MGGHEGRRAAQGRTASFPRKLQRKRHSANNEHTMTITEIAGACRRRAQLSRGLFFCVEYLNCET
jgi:hypothetical protein